MNYQKIYKNDMVNGEGVRTTLFVSGCDHGCKGCYNKTTWNPRNGEPLTEEVIQDILDSLEPDHVSGLSLTGGDPLYHDNLPAILELITRVRWRYGDNKNIWLWTGYTKKEIEEGVSGLYQLRRRIIAEVDVLVDGKFEQDKYDPELAFRGSSNQVIHRFTEF